MTPRLPLALVEATWRLNAPLRFAMVASPANAIDAGGHFVQPGDQRLGAASRRLQDITARSSVRPQLPARLQAYDGISTAISIACRFSIFDFELIQLILSMFM